MERAQEVVGPRAPGSRDRLAVEGLAGGDRDVDIGPGDREGVVGGILVHDRDSLRRAGGEAVRVEGEVRDRDRKGGPPPWRPTRPPFSVHPVLPVWAPVVPPPSSDEHAVSPRAQTATSTNTSLLILPPKIGPAEDSWSRA